MTIPRLLRGAVTQAGMKKLIFTIREKEFFQMPRARNIKPGFFKNEKLAELSPYARLLFIGLWCLADVKGRLEDRPARIRAEVLPYETVDVNQLLNELAISEGDFITRYEVDGHRFIEVTNFHLHQSPHPNEKKKGSQIPSPVMDRGKSRLLVGDQSITSPADILNPDILNPSISESLQTPITGLVELPDLDTVQAIDSQENATFRNDIVLTGTIWDEGEAYFIQKGIEPTKAKAVINQATKDHGLLVVSEALSVVLAALPDRPLPYFETVLKSKASKPVKRDPMLVHDPTLSPFDCAEVNGCGICMPKVKAMKESLGDCA
jgi:hypothetical protein